MAINPLQAWNTDTSNPLGNAPSFPPEMATDDGGVVGRFLQRNVVDPVGEWLAKKHKEAIDRGLWVGGEIWQGGRPTRAGVMDALHQTAEGVAMGTTSSGGGGRPGVRLPTRPATENVSNVLDAQFVYGRDLGPRTMPIDKLTGGVAMDNPKQAARVTELKTQMSGPEGYISRPIVDTQGNVIEGQHRLEALRQLGVKNVPVHVIEDLAAGLDTDALHAAIQKAQRMHGDQRTQFVRDLLETTKTEGSPAAVMSGYDAPPGYEAAWKAGLDFLERGDAATMEIIRRYGLAGLMGGGAAAATQQQPNALVAP